MLMGQQGQSRTPRQGQDIVFAILGVVGVQSHRRECLLGPLALLAFAYTPLYSLNSLNSLPPSRMGQRGQSQTLGQGQDSSECRVLLSLFDEYECVATYSALRRSCSW